MAYANPDAVIQIANGVSTSTFVDNNSGNLCQKTTDGTTTTYVWDYANRLAALGSGGATTTFGYDWAGNRVYPATSTTVYPSKFYSVTGTTVGATTTATSTGYSWNGDTLLAAIDRLLINGGTLSMVAVTVQNTGFRRSSANNSSELS
jgi:hypothetical protein